MVYEGHYQRPFQIKKYSTNVESRLKYSVPVSQHNSSSGHSSGLQQAMSPALSGGTVELKHFEKRAFKLSISLSSVILPDIVFVFVFAQYLASDC